MSSPSPSRFSAALLLAALFTAPAAAQVGGFEDGDLWLHSAKITGSSFADGAILRIDTDTWTSTTVASPDRISQRFNAMAFDSYRKRMIFTAELPGEIDQVCLWAMDGNGTTQRLSDAFSYVPGISPTGDGRVYFVDPYKQDGRLRMLDAANRVHIVRDATGAVPFLVNGLANNKDQTMAYDAGENALYLAMNELQGGGCAGVTGKLYVRKLPLSADGLRVAGPILCANFDVDPDQATEEAVQFAPGPNGELLLISSNSHMTTPMPRMVTIDPVDLTISTWAQNDGYVGAADHTAGCYLSDTNEVLLLDTRNDMLRSFAYGATGAGTTIPVTGPISADPGYNEFATLIQVDTGDCKGSFLPFGQGLQGAGDFVPGVFGSGCAELGQPMQVNVDAVVGGAPGFVMFGIGQSEVPYRGGHLYLDSALLTWPVVATGAAGVPGDGGLLIDFGTLADPNLAGMTFVMQAGFFDGAAPAGSSLTQGLRIQFP